MKVDSQKAMARLDVPRLVEDIKTAAAEIITLKEQLRAPWTRPMVSEQVRLVGLKRQVTALCVLRAWLRGRYHVSRKPHDSDAAGAIRMWCWGGAEAWDKDKFTKLVVANEAPAYQLVSTEEHAARRGAAPNPAVQVHR